MDFTSAIEETSEEGRPSAGTYRPGYEMAAERIMAYIGEAQLPTGARLPTERELSEELGISRSVTREAVKILSAVGQLSVEKGRGIYVADPGSPAWAGALQAPRPSDPEQIRSLFELRRSLETLAVRLACERATPVQVRALSTAADASGAAARANDVADFRIADDQFHRRIAVAANNEYLVTTFGWLQQLHQQMSTLALDGIAAGPLVDAAQQHARIASAVKAGDAGLAVRLVSEHIDRTQHQVERIIRERIFKKPQAPR